MTARETVSRLYFRLSDSPEDFALYAGAKKMEEDLLFLRSALRDLWADGSVRAAVGEGSALYRQVQETLDSGSSREDHTEGPNVAE